MVTARELQARIINMVNEITDVNQLAEIHEGVQERIGIMDSSQELPWKDAVVVMKNHVSFEDIMAEQGEKSLSFEELRSLADGIQWGCTLEEVLELLD